PRVDGRQLITCARSIFVSSLPAACQSFTQKVRVGPWTAKVEPSSITGTGSATVPARNVSSNSGRYGLNLSNWTSTALSSISAGGNSTGSSDSSNSRVSVCSLRFLTTGISQLTSGTTTGYGFKRFCKCSARSETFTLSCSHVSRSRTVTASSSSDW